MNESIQMVNQKILWAIVINHIPRLKADILQIIEPQE